MKVKGSKEFSDYEGINLKHNLKKMIRQKGDCTGISCIDCIFSSFYAEDKNCCGDNSVFKSADKLMLKQHKLRFKKAKEILEELM